MLDVNTHIPLREKNIVLIGFMGAGKTTVGQLLAQKLEREFIDADQAIEQAHGMPVTEIFQSLGEPAFRQIEKEYIVGLCGGQRNKVISLGGGSFMQEEIREACLGSSRVVYLDLSWDAWLRRFELLIDTRPLLQSKSVEEVEQLFNSRRPVYESGHHVVNVDTREPEELAETIARTLRAEWERGE
ncbi:shikimate kinase [Saccharibacillus sp. CPCC 101409]|uniref:shikimate kinase n=1 Tax=Saccharibacillus sp. CPCC 101409 TaxID=3058041 RepID=UPI00267215F3|nr:shikimate kinase [Saccharibacillus sp. CPCC 101409]MDO3410509.1 shikimate kinase [Saccharibacillus sp. CPCC 101409]